jgi:hypothetical protein
MLLADQQASGLQDIISSGPLWILPGDRDGNLISDGWNISYRTGATFHTVRDRLMGHLRVNVPRARIYWPSQLLVCVKLRTNVLSCCVNSGMAENASWSGLGGNFLTWATNLEMPRNGPPGHLLDNYLHKSYDFVKMCFHMLVEASQIFSRF